MTYDKENDHITLSTGRTFYAYGGFLSIGVEGTRYFRTEIGFGFDGTALPDGAADFTLAEKREIAEHMVAQWKHWGRLP